MPKRKIPSSGFFIQVTDGFGRLNSHTIEAAAFLREHELELSRLSRYPGVTDLWLDFGYNRDPDAAVQCDYLPPELLTRAGSLGIGIELSLYPPANDDEDDDVSDSAESPPG